MSESAAAEAEAAPAGSLSSHPWKFYHKPSLGGRGGDDGTVWTPLKVEVEDRLYIALPLHEEATSSDDEKQDDEFSTAIISWPELTVLDEMEVKRSQLMFLTTMMFNLVFATVVFVNSGKSPGGVLHPVNPNGIPGAFDVPQVHKSAEQLYFAVVWLIGAEGSAAALYRHELGILLFILGTTINVLLGSLEVPTALTAARYMIDAALLPLAWALYRRIAPTVVEARVRGVS